MAYQRTQRGWWHLVLLAFGAAVTVSAWLTREHSLVAGLGMALAVTLVFLALMFGSLTVRDEGDRLTLVYGPLPLFRKTIWYEDITAAEPGRITIIDGWGIHYIPGRGWTYNLWGFGCVKLTLGKKVVRVGSDDADNLAKLIQSKLH